MLAAGGGLRPLAFAVMSARMFAGHDVRTAADSLHSRHLY